MLFLKLHDIVQTSFVRYQFCYHISAAAATGIPTTNENDSDLFGLGADLAFPLMKLGWGLGRLAGLGDELGADSGLGLLSFPFRLQN